MSYKTKITSCSVVKISCIYIYMKIVLLHLLLLLMYPGKRGLFIFYNQLGAVLKNKQLAELEKDRNGLEERDIIIHLFEKDSAKDKVKEYHIRAAKAFTIILIGKDGGEKLRFDSVLSTKKLFAAIDAMPMRKAEMKNK